MRQAMVFLIFVVPVLTLGQSHMGLQDGIYLNSSFCDEMVTNDRSNDGIYLQVVNECSFAYKGFGLRGSSSTYNVVYQTGFPVQAVEQELVDLCTKAENRSKRCLPQFYDKDGNFLLQTGDIWRHGHTVQILGHDKYTKAFFEQFERDGKVFLTFTHETGMQYKPVYHRQK